MAIALIAAAAIAIILLAANVTMANAQQQVASQNSAIERGTTTSRSTRDSFRVQVPQGWVIHDVKNSGSALVAEALDGVGILAQLCPGEEQQQVAFRNPGGNTSNSSISINSDRCQGAQVIHVIRYPNLGARLGLTSDDIFAIINRDTIPNAILTYQIQKLQEAGYRNIQIVNSTDTAINVDISTGLNNNDNNAITAGTTTTTTTIVPAKLVAMTYSTNLAPNETRIGYFILTATAATPRNLGMITGYSIFYEGNSVVETVSSGSSVAPPPPTPFPAAARQVFGSFELIAAAPAEPLTVEITSSDTEGVAPATFDFEANVTGGTVPYTYSWDFGDGSVESDDDETVDHTFNIAGTYTVSATVTDSTGRTVSDSILITVEAPLAAVEPEPEPDGGTSPAVDDDDDDGGAGGGGGTFEDCIVPPGRDPGDVGC